MGLFDIFRRKQTDVEDYRQQLQARWDAQSAQTPGGTVLLEVEDVFSITGRGTVVVGTCQAAFGVQDAVIVVNPVGNRRESVVVGLEKFRTKLDSAAPGESVGVLLRGLDRQDVCRGALLEKKQ